MQREIVDRLAKLDIPRSSDTYDSGAGSPNSACRVPGTSQRGFDRGRKSGFRPGDRAHHREELSRRTRAKDRKERALHREVAPRRVREARRVVSGDLARRPSLSKGSAPVRCSGTAPASLRPKRVASYSLRLVVRASQAYPGPFQTILGRVRLLSYSGLPTIFCAVV
jgi:hypothetical protein